MKRFYCLFFMVSLVLISCGGKKEEPKEGSKMNPMEQTELFTKAKQIFGVLPDKMPGSDNDTPELIELGKKLYNDTRLSVNNTESCNTCHDLNNGKAGVDNKPTSDGAHPGKVGRRNSPTVLNAGYQFAQFWDGRAADLKEQAKGPILNPDEMAMASEKEVIKVVSGAADYKDLFDKAYPKEKEKITYDNIANAIAAFERTLISKCRFDAYVGGDQNALNDQEKMGLKTFIDVGCITCHTGPLFGGTMYQKAGLIHPYENTKDLGRYEVTKVETDKYMFKVPILRNIELTYPYFHDGAVPTIEDAVKKMAYINLGKELKPEELSDIVAFLKALTDTKLGPKVSAK